MSSTFFTTREKIIETAANLLLESNGKGVRMADIARASGVSRQAVYLHFPSRGELMIAAVRHLDDVYGLAEEVKRFREAQTGIEVLETFIEFWGNYIPKVYGVAKALMAVRETDEAAAIAWRDRMESVRSGCRRTIETIEHECLLSPDWTVDEAVDLMWTTLSIENWERLTNDCRWTQQEYISRMKTTLGKLLLKR
ncbi:MAG: TetR/AcrR family transcriptional regulator [Pyrinomonadaceae bacterium]